MYVLATILTSLGSCHCPPCHQGLCFAGPQAGRAEGPCWSNRRAITSYLPYNWVRYAPATSWVCCVQRLDAVSAFPLYFPRTYIVHPGIQAADPPYLCPGQSLYEAFDAFSVSDERSEVSDVSVAGSMSCAASAMAAVPSAERLPKEPCKAVKAVKCMLHPDFQGLAGSKQNLCGSLHTRPSHAQASSHALPLLHVMRIC